MALLKQAELPGWLLRKFGSAIALSRALGVTRQTAHNLLTGRTVPSYENCEKLGLTPAFLLREPEGSVATSLDDFLAEREQNQLHAGMFSAAGLNEMLSGERGTSMLNDVIRAVQAKAAQVGGIGGVPFEWNDGGSGGALSPLLKLAPVGAQFKGHIFTLPGSVKKGPYVDFGWVNRRDGIRVGQLPDRIWRLSLSSKAGAIAWNVNDDEIVGASSLELAEQIVKCLIEYRDEFLAKAVAGVHNSFRMEGLMPDAETAALLERYTSGSLSLAELGMAIERHVARMEGREAAEGAA